MSGPTIVFPKRRQERGDTAAVLAAANGGLGEVLLLKEICVETDTGRIKVGDGVTNYNAQLYWGWGRIDLSTLADGYIPAWDAANSKFVMVAQSGGGSGAMTLVGTATVAGSAATTLTMSSLSLSADKCYLILFALKNATASNSNVSLYYNADTTAANYYRQTVQSNSTALSGARANDGFAFQMVASAPATGDMEILADFDGRPRAFIRNSLGAASSIQIHDVRHVRDNTANVTSITLSASVANSMAVGSYFKVFKVN